MRTRFPSPTEGTWLSPRLYFTVIVTVNVIRWDFRNLLHSCDGRVFCMHKQMHPARLNVEQ